MHPDILSRGRKRRRRDHELIWARSGTGEHEVDGVSSSIEPGKIVVVGRGQVHRFRPARAATRAAVRFRREFWPVRRRHPAVAPRETRRAGGHGAQGEVARLQAIVDKWPTAFPSGTTVDGRTPGKKERSRERWLVGSGACCSPSRSPPLLPRLSLRHRSKERDRAPRARQVVHRDPPGDIPTSLDGNLSVACASTARSGAAPTS